jgi:3-dehydro-4-phosphotetronate decarboxylase
MSDPIDETALRRQMCELCASLFVRGLAHGSAGNVSARVGDRVLMSPTNSSLGRLEPGRLSMVDFSGQHLSGDRPTKEAGLHVGIYRARPSAQAIVHLHSTYATLLSCLADTDPENALAPITPYLVMRVGRVPMVPYHRPGSDALAQAVSVRASEHAGILMANHGFCVAARSFEDAVNTAEEFEESAKLLALSRGAGVRLLARADLADLEKSFGRP